MIEIGHSADLVLSIGSPLDEARVASHPLSFAGNLVANGYSCFPIPPRSKRAISRNWQRYCSERADTADEAAWKRLDPASSLAIACGFFTIGVDIDEADPDRAEFVQNLVEKILGPSPLVRIGQAPKRLLVYRTAVGEVGPSWSTGKVDLIGDGRYFIAYGYHPKTGEPYLWGDLQPLNLCVRDIPSASVIALHRLQVALQELDELRNLTCSGSTRTTSLTRSAKDVSTSPDSCKVTDGRDVLLRDRVFHHFSCGLSSAEDIAAAAWADFAARADITRPKRNGRRPWSYEDALAKARYLIKSGKPRPAFNSIVPSRQILWTPEKVERFNAAVNALAVHGKLTPSAAHVSATMMTFLGVESVCFASCETIGRLIDRKANTVKKARRELRDAGLWTSRLTNGGRGKLAYYSPSIDIIETAASAIGVFSL